MNDRLSVQERYAPQNRCFGCGPANPKGLRIRSFEDGDGLTAEWTPESHHEAWPGALNGGIVGVTHAKDDLVFRVILNAVAAEALIHLGIDSAQRLEDGNRRSKGWKGLPAFAAEAADAPQAEQIKAHAA